MSRNFCVENNKKFIVNGSNSSTYKAIIGDTITVNAVPAEGYTLNRIECFSGTTTNDTVTFTMPNKHNTVKVYFEKKSYTVTWKDNDGAVLKTDTVSHGDTPSYGDENPSKPDEVVGQTTTSYTFTGWTPAIAPATEDVTYTATYTSESLTYWQKLQTMIDSAENNGTVKLTKDYTATEDDSALIIPADKSLTIDLNGYTIDRGLSDGSAVENGNVITNNGTLTIADTSDSKTGKITGGNNTGNGGGIINNGTLILSDAKITDNRTGGNGGGIYCKENCPLKVSGLVIVTDNYKGENKDNAYLSSNGQIKIIGKLDDNAKISVKCQFQFYTGISDVASGAKNNAVAANFESDVNDRDIRLNSDGDRIQLLQGGSVIVVQTDHGTVTADVDKAVKDEIIHFTISPDEGYDLKVLNCKYTTQNGAYTGDRDYDIESKYYSYDDDGNLTINYPMPYTTNGRITVTPTFSRKTYYVYWYNDNGSTLWFNSSGVAYGNVPTYGGQTPTKASTDDFDYEFIGWSDGTQTYAPNEIPALTYKNIMVSFTAVYKSVCKHTLVEAKAATIQTPGNIEYYKDENGKLYLKNGDILTETTEKAVTIPAFKDVIFNPTSDEDENLQKFFDKDNMTYRSLDLLGVQLKEDHSKHDIRFITVVNSDILASGEVKDYGYIFTATSKSQTEARDNIDKLTLENASHIYSCKDTYNTFTEKYGTTDFTSTPYKYVTAAINDIPEGYTIGSRFYVELTNGDVLYATYNPGETTYNGCAVNFDELVNALN